jgi:hypothetical protein
MHIRVGLGAALQWYPRWVIPLAGFLQTSKSTPFTENENLLHGADKPVRVFVLHIKFRTKFKREKRRLHLMVVYTYSRSLKLTPSDICSSRRNLSKGLETGGDNSIFGL